MRTPDPWLIENKNRLAVMALAGGAMGVLLLLLSNTYPRIAILQLPGVLLAFGAVFGWIILVNRITPRVTDYTEYLETLADEEGCGEWLNGANTGFMEAWGLKRLGEIGHE